MLARHFSNCQFKNFGAAHSQPLGVICLAGGEESTKRVVSRNHETRNVGQQLTTEVENDQEEVERSEAEHSVGLGNRGLLFEVVQGRVFGELLHCPVSTEHSSVNWLGLWFAYLFVKLGDIVLNTILRRRHCCGV